MQVKDHRGTRDSGSRGTATGRGSGEARFWPHPVNIVRGSLSLKAEEKEETTGKVSLWHDQSHSGESSVRCFQSTLSPKLPWPGDKGQIRSKLLSAEAGL